MSIGANAIAHIPIAADVPDSSVVKAPKKRTTMAKADTASQPEPR